MKYLIWYDSLTGEYNWGNEYAYEIAVSSSTEDAILAEVFINTSDRIVEKITSKLNKNLILVKQ